MSTNITMDILARDRASRTLDHVGNAADRSADRWRKFGSVARSAGIALGAGLVTAGTGAYKLAQMASDLGETQSKTNAIFGKQGAAALSEWSQSADTALGQSQQTALDAAATFGVFGKAAGKTGEDLAKFGMQNTELAADLSSFHNTSPEVAIEALGAAFRGEAEPIRQFGILLDDATLRNEALKLGLIKTTKDALTPSQKVLAAQAAILKQTGDAQGDFAKTSGGLANQQRILAAQVQNVGTDMGQVFLPALVGAATYANRELVPAVREVWEAFEDNGIDGLVSKIEALTGTQGDLKPVVDDVRRALGSASDIITGSLIPAVGDVTRALPPFMSPLGLVADVLELMAEHSDLTKYAIVGLSGVLTANAASTLLAKVASSQLVTSLTMQGTAAERTAAKQKVLQSALRGAAGMGGMLALSAGAETSNDALGLLASAGGGAMLGFAVGGPVGAAIGGGAGALMHLATSTDEATDSMKAAKPPTSDYAASLNQVSGAATQATRELLALDLQKQGLIEASRVLGINSRDLVRSAINPEGEAAGRVSRQMARLSGDYYDAASSSGDLTDEQRKLVSSYEAMVDKLDPLKASFAEQQAGFRELRAASGNLSKTYRGFPKRVITHMDLKGVPASTRDLARLATRFKLTPKQISTIINIRGVDTSVGQVRRVGENLAKVDAAKVTLRAWLGGIETAIDKGAKISDAERRTIVAKLEGIEKAHPDLSPYVESVRTAVQNATIGAQGSTVVGARLKSGLLSGMYGTSTALSAIMAGAVRDAIAAARREADVRSPSRKTYVIGQMLGRGTELGLENRKQHLSAAAANLMAHLVSGIRKGAVPAERALRLVESYVDKTIDRLNAVKAAQRDTVSAFQGFSTSMFAAQAPESGGFTVDSLLAFQVAERDKARQVAAAVRKLTDMGLSGSLIKQMQAGGAGGIDQLLALASGNRAQIQLANSLNAQTQAAYTAAGTRAGNELYGDRLAQAATAATIAKAVERAIERAMKDREAKYEFVLRGNTLVAILKREERDNGRA